MLHSYRESIFLIASAINIIGIPIIITLLFKIYDIRLKILEKQTFKAVKDEIAALQELQSLEEEILKKKLAKAEQYPSKDLDNKDIEERIGMIRRLRTMGTDMPFLLESSMYHRVMKCLEPYEEFQRTKDILSIFSEYEKSLADQLVTLKDKDAGIKPMD
jgi:hypothetical protein